MSSFSEILSAMQRDCAWETIPYDTITALAKVCGPAEVEHLIGQLDALDDADLVDDAGDVGDEYWRLRTAYAQALVEVGEPAIEPLLGALDSANPQTRVYAAKAIGRLGTPRAFQPIVKLLAAEREDTLQMGLLEALGSLRDARAVPILLPYLNPSELLNRGWIIRMAANALGMIGTAAVIDPLAAVLANDPHWLARVGAAEGLQQVRHPRAAAALQQALQDEDERVRAAAAASLP